jgi:hypothetical protein
VAAETRAETPTVPQRAAHSPIASAPQPTAQELRQSVSNTLRREATSTGTSHEQALADLVAVYGQLRSDTQLPDAERRRRLGQVRQRLADEADELEQLAAERAERAKAAERPTPADVLAQVGPGNARGRGIAAGRQQNVAGRGPPVGQGPAGAAGANSAQDLIDLIRTTIAPDTWDIRGGPGTIMYFAPRQVLVIRQTDEVHGQFGDLMRQLRR